MPPQRSRPREYETSVDPEALHIEPEKLKGFGDAREVLKKAEVDHLRAKAARADELEAQLNQALAEQGQGSALMVQDDGALMVQGFQFSPTGLIAPTEVSFESWEELGHLLLRLEGSIQWLLGDWLVWGTDLKYGDIDQIAASLGREAKTLYDYVYVARNVEFSVRTENVSWAHHSRVAKLPPEQQVYALTFAADHGYTFATFRKWLNQGMPADGIRQELSAPAPSPESTFKSLGQEIDKLMQRDITTLKDKEKEEFLERLFQMQRILAETVQKLRGS